jgi:hypothetical protein
MGNCCVTFFGDSFGTRCININLKKIARKKLISKDSDVEPKVRIIENISVEVERKKKYTECQKKDESIAPLFIGGF